MKIGIIFGAFDLLHAGHIHLLKEARKNCDFLLVALHVDPSIERPEKNKPIESLWERSIKLKACKEVSGIIAYEKEDDIEKIIKFHNVSIRFLGSDYAKVDPYNPPQITAESTVPIQYIDSIDIHTSDIRGRIKNS